MADINSKAEHILQAYSAVRQMLYFSGADRTPMAALRDGRGACTAKHLVLRDALRKAGRLPRTGTAPDAPKKESP